MLVRERERERSKGGACPLGCACLAFGEERGSGMSRYGRLDFLSFCSALLTRDRRVYILRISFRLSPYAPIYMLAWILDVPLFRSLFCLLRKGWGRGKAAQAGRRSAGSSGFQSLLLGYV